LFADSTEEKKEELGRHAKERRNIKASARTLRRLHKLSSDSLCR